MIRKITEEREIEALFREKEQAPDIYTEKISALYRAYGLKYDFCKFFLQDKSMLIGDYYGSAVVSLLGDTDQCAADELAEFLSFSSGEILMPYGLYEKTTPPAESSAEKLFVMKYSGESITTFSEIDKCTPDTNISLGEAYEIIKDGFDIDRDKWYTDTSHNLRHGISLIYTLKKSACAVRMFSENGISFYSYICTKADKRGQGLASQLIKWIQRAENINKNCIYLICTGTLKGFYEKLGFSVSGYSASIIKNRNER